MNYFRKFEPSRFELLFQRSLDFKVIGGTVVT